MAYVMSILFVFTYFTLEEGLLCLVVSKQPRLLLFHYHILTTVTLGVPK